MDYHWKIMKKIDQYQNDEGKITEDVNIYRLYHLNYCSKQF